MGTTKDYIAFIDGMPAVQGDIPYIAEKLYISTKGLRNWLQGRNPRHCALKELPVRWLVGGKVMSTEQACLTLGTTPRKLAHRAHEAERQGRKTPLRLRYKKTSLTDDEIDALQASARVKARRHRRVC